MKRLNVMAACLAGAVALVGGFAVAQEDGPTPAPSTKAATFDDQVEQQARNLTSEEKLEVSKERIDKMQETLTQTNQVLDETRSSESSDILKVNCISEKLGAIKGFVKVSEQSYGNLREASSAGDGEAEVHHFTLIAIAGQKVGDLGEEALTCVGDVQLFADETVVERREDPDIADVDPIEVDDDEFDDSFATETLPELTPFQ